MLKVNLACSSRSVHCLLLRICPKIRYHHHPVDKKRARERDRVKEAVGDGREQIRNEASEQSSLRL